MKRERANALLLAALGLLLFGLLAPREGLHLDDYHKLCDGSPMAMHGVGCYSIR